MKAQQKLLSQYHQLTRWQQDYLQLMAHIGANREVNRRMRKKLRQLAKLVIADYKRRCAGREAAA